MCSICHPFLVLLSLASKWKMEEGRLFQSESMFLISDVQLFEIGQNFLKPKCGSIFKSADAHIIVIRTTSVVDILLSDMIIPCSC